MFKMPYIRPVALPVLNSLRDVVGDVSSVLLLPDDAIGLPEYSKLFPVGAPESAFDELIYFFPRACEALFWNPDEALDCIDGLVAFASTCDARLSEKNLKCVVQSYFISCLDKWTQKFSVLHYDRSKMQAVGSRHNYADCVMNSDVVLAMLGALVRFRANRDLAEHYFLHWSSAGRLGCESSGWFVESCGRYLAEEYEATPLIVSALTRQDAREYHFRRLKESKSLLGIPQTYLNDMSTLLQVPA